MAELGVGRGFLSAAPYARRRFVDAHPVRTMKSDSVNRESTPKKLACIDVNYRRFFLIKR
jgi:hypothetical protein